VDRQIGIAFASAGAGEARFSDERGRRSGHGVLDEGMNIQLCKKSLERLGGPAQAMVSSLRDQEHTIVVKDCLDRCGGCQQGLVIASVDGMPVSTRDVAGFVAQVAELAADE
jgi:hypothetical protein